MTLIIKKNQAIPFVRARVEETLDQLASILAPLDVERGECSLAITDPIGARGTLAWDDMTWTRTTPMGRAHQLTHDLFGRATRARFSSGLVVDYAYDAKGRLEEVRVNGRLRYRLKWHANILEQLQLADGSTRDYERDATGRLRRLVEAGRARAVFERDTRGRIIAFGDNPERLTRLTFDGEVVGTITRPDGRRFDLRHRGQRLMDVRVDGATLCSYDYEGAFCRATYADGSWNRYAFDAGDLVYAESDQGYVRRVYADTGHLLAEVGLGSYCVCWYGPTGSLARFSDSGRGHVHFHRDLDGMLSAISYPDGSRFGFARDDGGVLSRISFPNGTTQALSWNDEVKQADFSLRAPDGSPLCWETYSYDARSRLTSRTTREGEHRYQYDALGRLVTERIELDHSGNRLRYGDHAARYSATNQLLELGQLSYTYDVHGSLSTRKGPDGLLAYRYREGSRLTEVFHDGELLARYYYDPLGRRVAKQAHGRTTRFQWALDQVVAETIEDEHGTTHIEYLWHPEQWLLLGMWIDGRRYCIHSDQRGAPIGVTDDTGALVWSAEYDAFGNVSGGDRSFWMPWRLPGQYHDEETGLYYNGARYYDPFLGRYLSPDPLGAEGGSFNYYLYCDGDPLNKIDPLGEFPLPALAVAIMWGLGIGAGVGAAVDGGSEAVGQISQAGEVTDWPAVGMAAVKGGAKGGVIGAASGGAGAVVGPMLSTAAKAAPVAGKLLVSGGTGFVEGVTESCAADALEGEPCDIGDAMVNGGTSAAISAATFGVGDNIARKGMELDAPMSYAERAAAVMDDNASALSVLDNVELPVGSLPEIGEHLGTGQYMDAFASADGSMVIKEVRDTIGGVLPVTDAERAALALRTVEQHNILREAGFAIPQSWVPDANPFAVVQQMGTGVPIGQLAPELRSGAASAGVDMWGLATKATNNSVAIDNKLDSMLFEPATGKISSWFDPSAPTDGALSSIESRVWAARP